MPNFDMPHDRKDRKGKPGRVNAIPCFFQFCIERFQWLGTFFCNFGQHRIFVFVSAPQPESRPVSRAPVYYI